MVHTLFAWCHGGRQVFLLTSSNGWTVPIQMSMVEGSLMNFQTICDLPPGYHQYIFLVDGEWRIDDQQPCFCDEHGRVNNLILVRPEHSSSTSQAETSRPNINIENNASSSSGIYHERIFQHNEADASRHQLAIHLSSNKLYDLIPDSGKVIVLDVNVAMEEAFLVMYEQGLAVVPLWDDCSRQIVGMLTASDFVMMLMEEQLEMHSISAWKERKLQLCAQAVGGQLFKGPLVQVGPDESLKDLSIKILQNKMSSVPVINSAEDGFCLQLLHIACLGGILNNICRHFRLRLESLPILQQPVGNLPLGTWREIGRASRCQLLTLRPSDFLRSAFYLLLEAQISSIPIVDDTGALVNVYSRSDITSLAKGGLYAHIRLDQTKISQALELVDNAPRSRFQTCTRSDSLFRVMELLSDPAVRRLIVVKAGSWHVEGVITLRDVFNFILS